MSSSEDIDAGAADQAWREIERLVDEFSEFAAANPAAAALHAALVDRAARATGAQAAVLWTRTEDGRFQPEHHRHVERLRLAEDVQARQLHAKMLDESAASNSTRWIRAGTGITSDQATLWNREHTLSFTPLWSQGLAFAVLELAHAPFDAPEMERGCQNLLERFAQHTVAWRLQSCVADLERRDRWAREREAFAIRLHHAFDLPSVVGELVQGVRRLLAADRVTLTVRNGNRQRIEAVSGVESLDRRGDVSRSLDSLANAVARTGEVVRWGGARTELAPQIATPLDAYLDIAHPRSLILYPLVRPAFAGDAGSAESSPDKRGAAPEQEPLAVVIVERFGGGDIEEDLARLRILAPHLAIALGNAWEYSTLPGAGLLRSLRAITGSARRRRQRLWIIASVLLALVATLAIPVDFTIAARGELQPIQVRDLFAPVDGEVARLLVKHEQRVAAKQPVLELQSAPLQLERERLAGEYGATRERLLAVESARLLDKPRDRDTTLAASASEAELRQAIESLESQLAIVDRQRESLRIVSPMAGEIMTWNPDELLDSRPVKRGQRLLRVGNVDGAWEARLDVLDERAGHVLTSFERSQQKLPVSFVLATSPGRRHSGVLRRMDRVTGTDHEGRPVVHAYVDIEKEQVSPLRPGATVIARVSCGRRPLGYVWFHELYEYLQTQIFF